MSAAVAAPSAAQSCPFTADQLAGSNGSQQLVATAADYHRAAVCARNSRYSRVQRAKAPTTTRRRRHCTSTRTPGKASKICRSDSQSWLTRLPRTLACIRPPASPSSQPSQTAVALLPASLTTSTCHLPRATSSLSTQAEDFLYPKPPN